MSADLKAKLAQLAARLATTRERLQGLERSAAGVRQDLEQLRAEVERGAEPGSVPADDEWGPRVPTRHLVGAGELAPDDDGAAPAAATGDLPPPGDP